MNIFYIIHVQQTTAVLHHFKVLIGLLHLYARLLYINLSFYLYKYNKLLYDFKVPMLLVHSYYINLSFMYNKLLKVSVGYQYSTVHLFSLYVRNIVQFFFLLYVLI